MKWRWNRGCDAGQAFTPGCLWVASLSRIICTASPFGTRRSMVRRNSRTPQRTRVAISHVPMPGQALPDHQSVSTSNSCAGVRYPSGTPRTAWWCRGGGSGGSSSQRPFFIGSEGWVRSSALHLTFSSIHSTTAFSGGLKYRPTHRPVLLERRTVRQLERLDQMRLEPTSVPDPLHRSGTHSELGSHGAATPMLLSRWSRVQRRRHDRLHRLGRDRRFGPAPGPYPTEPGHPVLAEPPPPRPNRRRRHPQLRSDPIVGHPLRSHQQRPRPQHLPMRRSRRLRQRLQHPPLTLGNLQRLGSTIHPTRIPNNPSGIRNTID